MAVFKYVTRGEQTAQGKQKAYFCAHPDDYGRYFDKITNEILDTLAKENNRNCAFFYLEDATAERDDDFKFSFKEMNLIVMPVTTRLLTTANPALDIEFRLAAEYGIPVLPIMMESELADVFNAKCGDIQYLDPNSRDATAISYEEKLTKYLTSVLIGDELAEKIRKAFDAYIFLSYRKKDRKYAQELMRLIHKNDFCRDIAIWYDEFLTPGEDFNKSIEDALNKSKLFALAVTPNLVNEENYIMKVEYPMAKKADKLILPAELVETDKDALASNYPSIPDCVSANDEPILTAALENALEGIALRENDNDPEHNFFIGLAYLGGVDVEKDNDRAIKLITSAAEAGLVEAMEKLVVIYRNGEHVNINYEKAIEWQRRVVEVRKRIYESGSDTEKIKKYVFALVDMGDYTRDVGRLGEAQEIYTIAIGVMEEKQTAEYDEWYRAHIDLCYERCGDICFELKDMVGAEKYYSDAMKLRRLYYFEKQTVWAWEKLLLIYERLGRVHMKRGNHELAEKYYLKYIDLSRNYVSVKNNEGGYKNLSIGYDRMSALLLSHGDLDGALEYCLKSIDIREKGYNGTVTNESFYDTLSSYYNLADILFEKGDYEGAGKFYGIFVQFSESDEKSKILAKNKHELISAYTRLGDVQAKQRNIDSAEEYYKRSLEIAKKSETLCATVQTRRDSSVCYNRLGQIEMARGNFAVAEKYYAEALAITKQLTQETGDLECLRDLSVAFECLGRIRLKSGDHAGAEAYFCNSVEIEEELFRKCPVAEYREALSNSYICLGDIRMMLNDYKGAETYYLASVRIDEELSDELKVPKSRRSTAVTLHKLGGVALKSNDVESAEKYYYKAYLIFEGLMNDLNTPESVRDYAVACTKLGESNLLKDDLGSAKLYYVYALRYAEIYARVMNTAGAKRVQAAILEKLGDISYKLQDASGVAKYYIDAKQLRNDIATETHTADDYDALGIVLYKCSSFASPERDEYLNKAVAIYDMISKACPDNARYRRMYENLKKMI